MKRWRSAGTAAEHKHGPCGGPNANQGQRETRFAIIIAFGDSSRGVLGCGGVAAGTRSGNCTCGARATTSRLSQPHDASPDPNNQSRKSLIKEYSSSYTIKKL